MNKELSKREFLHLSSVGGVAAFMGLLTATKAEAKTIPPGTILGEIALALATISYLLGLGFMASAIFKFRAHKDNPNQNPNDLIDVLDAVWASLDDETAMSLANLGYSPESFVEAVEQAADGDASDLIAFFEDLKLLEY